MENKLLIYTIAIPILLLSIGFGFSLTGITLESFMTLNIFSLLESIFSLYGLLTIALTIITLSIVALVLSEPLDERELMIVLGAYLIGTIIGSLFSYEFVFAGVFSALGIIIGIKTQGEKEGFQKGKNITRKIVFFFVLGLLFTMLFVTYSNKETLEENFVDDMLTSTIGGDDYISQNLEKPVVELIVETQKQTINTVQTLPGYTELKSKNDLDAVKFTNALSEVENQIKSNSYKEELIKEIEKTDTGLTLNAIKETKVANNLSKYAWLIYSFGTFLITLLIGNLLISNLAAGLYWIYDKTLPKTNY